MLTDIDGLLNDFNRTVSDYPSDLEFDQNLFLQIEERLNIINRLKDKYGSTIEEIFQYQQQKQEEMERLLDADAYGKKLEKELKPGPCRTGKAVRKGPRKSGKTRARSCLPLLIDALWTWNFNQVDFSVALEKKEGIGPDGWDDAAFMISTNPGEPADRLPA